MDGPEQLSGSQGLRSWPVESLLSHLSIKILTIAVLLAGSCNLVSQFYRMHRQGVERQELFERSGIIVCKFGPSIDEVSRLFIEFFLMMAFVGSWMKDFKNTLLSVVGLTGVTMSYVFWWQYYFWLAEASGSDLESVEHIVYLCGASYLDIFIAASIAVLILLHVKLAVLSVFRPTCACS